MRRIASFILFLALLQSVSVLSMGESQSPAQKSETIMLSGHGATDTKLWDFKVSAGMNSGKWKKIAVPSCWEQQGFGAYTYGRFYTVNKQPSTESGFYKTSFIIPKSWNGKTIEIVFEGVMTDATVTINGKQAGAVHQGAFTAFSYDITDKVNIGSKNRLEVKVDKMSADATVNNAERLADWWLFGGIYRPVYLQAHPKTHITHVGLDAKADGTLREEIETNAADGEYNVKTVIINTKDNHRKEATKPITVKDGKAELALTFDGVKTWNPEQPHLYNIYITLLDRQGNALHEVSDRIGFRTIEFRKRDGFYLNGTKLLVKGVNRHCFYPETGRTAAKEWDVQDIKLIKGMNANAIRSHYAPNKDVLDICDSLGVLYLEELCGWQQAYSTKVGKQMVKEMVKHDANHPCIFLWSNGNEGGFNHNLDNLFAEYDPQDRHVVHAWALSNDVDTHHYPAYQTGVARLANGYEVFMPTEFLHAQYDKGAGTSLDDYWNQWSQSPLFAGGFIWAWADEGVVRKDLNDSIDTDGPNGPDGIVGPHREKEGSWFTIRDVWSPIQISPVKVSPSWNKTLTLENKYLFTSLQEVNMTYELLEIGNRESIIAKGSTQLPNIQPDCKGKLSLPITSGQIAKADILRLTATENNGDTINIWTWPTKGADEYYQKSIIDNRQSTIESRISKTDNRIPTIGSRKNFYVTFDEETGLIKRILINGKEHALKNGPVPVGFKAKLQSMKRRIEGTDTVVIAQYTGGIDSIVWRITPDGRLGMKARLFNSRNGKKFDGKFLDDNPRHIGLSFDYDESQCQGMTWFGKGPYRVWRNRIRGTQFGLWHKDWSNTITGESSIDRNGNNDGYLVYPEFKGFHANLYRATMESETSPFTVYSETDGLFYRVFTPQEPVHRRKGENTMEKMPAGDLSFLLDIQPMRSYKPLEQLGPKAMPQTIRINTGDKGLPINLTFDFGLTPIPSPTGEGSD